MFDEFKNKVANKHEKQLEAEFLTRNIGQPIKHGHIVTPQKQVLKQSSYSGPDILIQQIMNMYPDATHLIIIDNDNRDSAGVPLISKKTLRSRFTKFSWTQGKKVLHAVNYEVFVIPVCIIENGQVYFKTITSQFKPSEWSY